MKLRLVTLVYAQITCDSDKVYAKITKVTKDWANEESFKIFSGETIVYTSPSLQNSATRTLETCLPASTNNQYRLEMYDSQNDSWADGAWLSIEGINGNLAFKGMMTEASTEIFPISLYSPINKQSTWKYASTVSEEWTTLAFSDDSWTDYTTGTHSNYCDMMFEIRVRNFAIPCEAICHCLQQPAPRI